MFVSRFDRFNDFGNSLYTSITKEFKQYDYDNFKAEMKSNVLSIEVPGYSKDDIELTFDNNILTMTINDEDDCDCQSECKDCKCKITKSYRITEGFVIDSAKCENGLLTVRFKKQENPKTKVKID